MGADYFVVSLKHTRPTDRLLTLWGPDRGGYEWPLSWAGRYGAEEAFYLHDGTDDFAVPCSLLEPFTVASKPGEIDGGPHFCIPNTKAVRAVIVAFNAGRQAAVSPDEQVGIAAGDETKSISGEGGR